jgi:hydroxymethylpyrimidine pyrophosphatase-like HAD family hydrolase
MHLTILACDLDGTLAELSVVAPETWDALQRARDGGLTIILVTGRVLDDLDVSGRFSELCEATVAEDGAVVYFPRRDAVVLPFGRLVREVFDRLEEKGVPFRRGLAIAATEIPHDETVMQVLHQIGGGLALEYNRDSVMVLPLGATKGTGLEYALRELGYSPRNVVACGDAENDRSLFEVAELSVAVANALPEVQSHADVVLSQEDGAGVRALIDDLLAKKIPGRQPRPERRLLLGHDQNGNPVHLDPFLLTNGNLGIFGASRSGKSWLAGLLAEEMLRQGYQVFIVDPEGDYRSLRAFPHTLVMGSSDSRLPPVVDLINFSEYDGVSLVLDLSIYTISERYAYLAELMHALRGLRKRRGRPHWFLVDEVQNLCPHNGNELCDLIVRDMQEGGYTVVSYRPSQVAQSVLESLHHCLMTRMSLPEELEMLRAMIGQHGVDENLSARLPTLPIGQAYLCVADGSHWRRPPEGLVNLLARPRAIPHIRHMHKYLRAPLPQSKRFYFHDGRGCYLNRTAASLWEFSEVLRDLPLDSLQYHMERGDFEKWLSDVLYDEELAGQVRKIRHRSVQGDALRAAMVEAVSNRYEELDSLV